MRKKRIAVFAMVFLTILSGLVWIFSFPGNVEPSYEGKPLSYWLRSYDPYLQWNVSAQMREQSNTAVRKLGTNVIPILLRMLEKNDPTWKLKLIEFANSHSPVKIEHTPAAYLNFEASKAFFVLGADAKTATPKLIDIYRRNISDMSRYYTVLSLTAIGPSAKESVPFLVTGITNADRSMRHAVVDALGAIHPEPESVMPSLIKALDDPQFVTRQSAIQILGSYRGAAKPAVAALVKLLKDDPVSEVRKDAAVALKQIDPEAAQAAGAK